MIIDSLKRAEIYNGVHPEFKSAIELALKLYNERLPVGRYDGENGVYAFVQEYETKNPETPKLENHRDYIDIQIVANGKEKILVDNADVLELEIEYTPDAEFYLPKKDSGNTLFLEGDTFTVFFPLDAHAPGLSVDEVETVTKIVVKIPVIK